MSSANVNAVLNRLSVLHNRSLPMYLGYAVPWARRGTEEKAAAALGLLVKDHQRFVDLFGEMILDNGGDVASGEFPIRYSAYHDLSFDYLLPVLIEKQQDAVYQLESAADKLDSDPAAQALAQEALGAARGHLETLQELA